MRFDFEETFGDDYLHFYGGRFTDEHNDQDTDDIVTFLDLQPTDRVLDAPCGHGRISNRLAARGFDVVGVDASQPFLISPGRTRALSSTTVETCERCP